VISIVARRVRRLPPHLIHRPLDGVDQLGAVRIVEQRRPAGVTEQRRRQHLMAATQGGQGQLPGAPRVSEPVQKHERRAGAGVILSGEHEARA
jgi:hypothetical protein